MTINAKNNLIAQELMTTDRDSGAVGYTQLDHPHGEIEGTHEEGHPLVTCNNLQNLLTQQDLLKDRSKFLMRQGVSMDQMAGRINTLTGANSKYNI